MPSIYYAPASVLDARDKNEQVKALLPLRIHRPQGTHVNNNGICGEGFVGTEMGVYSDRGKEGGFRKRCTEGAIPGMRLKGRTGMVSKQRKAGHYRWERSEAVRNLPVFRELQVVPCGARKCAKRKTLEGAARDVDKGQLLKDPDPGLLGVQ